MSEEVKAFLQAIIFFVILLVIKFVFGYNISMVSSSYFAFGISRLEL